MSARTVQGYLFTLTAALTNDTKAGINSANKHHADLDISTAAIIAIEVESHITISSQFISPKTSCLFFNFLEYRY